MAWCPMKKRREGKPRTREEWAKSERRQSQWKDKFKERHKTLLLYPSSCHSEQEEFYSICLVFGCGYFWCLRRRRLSASFIAWLLLYFIVIILLWSLRYWSSHVVVLLSWTSQTAPRNLNGTLAHDKMNKQSLTLLWDPPWLRLSFCRSPHRRSFYY